jgi:putative selenium metabolism protein SsnA
MARQSLRNALLVSLLPGLRVERGGLVISDGVIVEAGPTVADTDPDAVDAQGALVLPGLVNAHTHLYSALAAGMPAPSVTPTNFPEILEHIWWRLDRALDPASILSSALVGALEAARSGVTTVFDHHASPSSITGSLGTLADALTQVGVTGVLCYEATDRGGPAQFAEGLAENVDFIHDSRNRQARGIRSGALVGGHAAFTLSDASLRELAETCNRLRAGFHIHVAEDLADFEPGEPIERLYRAGLLGPKTIIAHGVHLDANALETAATAECWLVHNPRSNMNNAVGYAALAADTYPKLALGTDGIGCDILTECRVSFLKAREAGLQDPWGLPLRLLQGGLRMAEEHTGATLGRLETGAAGDVIITDYVSSTPVTAANFAGHLLFGLDRSNIHAVWAQGKKIWPSPLDTRAIYAEARTQALALWQRMEGLGG